MSNQITEHEFWMMQAINRLQSIRQLKEKGFLAIKCECGDEKCHGWQLRQMGVDWPEEGISEPITVERMA